jgi:hypothetical protein
MAAATTAIDLVILRENNGRPPFISATKLMMACDAGKKLDDQQMALGSGSGDLAVAEVGGGQLDVRNKRVSAA